ncbi:MAG: RNA pseudouridine synthase [Candidatus Methylacidiphilales bacterium]|nr:RNA pseudouridine synthase [Candidatus Methylacidiphilales bacterium]
MKSDARAEIALRHRGTSVRLPVLYEDREVLVIDKPPGWMLAPADWKSTRRNLLAALLEGVEAGAWWARSRGLRFLRPVHRLDTDTSGVLLLAKSPRSLEIFSKFFAQHRMGKTYWALSRNRPAREEWVAREALAEGLDREGRIRVDPRRGRSAETAFRVLAREQGLSWILCQPLTGRTHQIRVHLAHAGCPILGDVLYGGEASPARGWPLALRAVELVWEERPGRSRRVEAPGGGFLSAFYGGHPPVPEEAGTG